MTALLEYLDLTALLEYIDLLNRYSGGPSWGLFQAGPRGKMPQLPFPPPPPPPVGGPDCDYRFFSHLCMYTLTCVFCTAGISFFLLFNHTEDQLWHTYQPNTSLCAASKHNNYIITYYRCYAEIRSQT